MTDNQDDNKIYKLKRTNDSLLFVFIVYASFSILILPIADMYFDLSFLYSIFDFCEYFLGEMFELYFCMIILIYFKFFRQSYIFKLSNGVLAIARGLSKRTKNINLADISMVKVRIAKRDDGDIMILFNSKGQPFFECHAQGQKKEMFRFLNDITMEIKVETQSCKFLFTKNITVTDYINPLYQGKNVIKSNIGNAFYTKNLPLYITLFILFLVFGMPLYINLLNNLIYK